MSLAWGPGSVLLYNDRYRIHACGDKHPTSLGQWRRAAKGQATGANRHTRILVVDDNEDAAGTIAEVLVELGYEVQIAHDGPSGLKMALQFKPNICLLDIGLPVMDGYDLARRIREIESMPPDLRLIASTGYGQEVDRRRSKDAGFNSHVVKPVNLEVLLANVVGN